jgi:hypothetical protein
MSSTTTSRFEEPVMSDDHRDTCDGERRARLCSRFPDLSQDSLDAAEDSYRRGDISEALIHLERALGQEFGGLADRIAQHFWTIQ